MDHPLTAHEPTVSVVDCDPGSGRAVLAIAPAIPACVKCYSSLEGFLEAAHPSAPACLLLDMATAGTDEFAVFERLGKAGISLPVIALGDGKRVPAAIRAMRAGCRNFLAKPPAKADLREALEDALAWDLENRPRILQQRRAAWRLAQLNGPEQQVLHLVVRGLSNREAAAELDVSVRTIEVRRSSIMGKLKARSLAELVRLTLVGEATSRHR